MLRNCKTYSPPGTGGEYAIQTFQTETLLRALTLSFTSGHQHRRSSTYYRQSSRNEHDKTESSDKRVINRSPNFRANPSIDLSRDFNRGKSHLLNLDLPPDS